MSLRFLLLLTTAVAVTGCGLLGEDTPAPTTTPAVVIPTPADTPPPPAGGEAPMPTPSLLELTIWTMADVAPRDDVPGGGVLDQQLSDFDASHPNVNLKVEVKTIADQGGALAYLRTGRSIAPSILPDLLLLPTDQLSTAVRQGLVYRLDALLTADMTEDLYPAAARLAQVDDTIYGYPYILSDLHHLAYDATVLSETVPADWPTLLNTPSASLAFPGDGARGADLVLQHYLARGGELVNEAGQPQLDEEILATVLADFAAAVEGGQIVPQSGTIISLDGAWQLFQSGGATMVQTSAAFYLRQRTSGTTARYAPFPGPEGPLRPLVSGRVWVITTSDPVQQALAAELISWLSSPGNLGDWSLQSQLLPARKSALSGWGDGDAYVRFLRDELARAEPRPTVAGGTLLGALSTALSDVLSLIKSPAAAAAEATGALTP